jgi:RimJ/RimL family protein N-acetyltransferase
VPIGLFIIKVKPKHGVFTISHLIGDRAWRGKDTTFLASELVYDYFFNTLGYAKATANVRPENKPMLWLMYNYVWRKEARLIKHLRLAETKERSDLLVFGMLADEWRTWHDRARATSQGGHGVAGSAIRPGA